MSLIFAKIVIVMAKRGGGEGERENGELDSYWMESVEGKNV